MQERCTKHINEFSTLLKQVQMSASNIESVVVTIMNAHLVDPGNLTAHTVSSPPSFPPSLPARSMGRG